jgi:AraC family transcriptional regulator
VLRNNELVPLLPSAQPGENRVPPWREVLVERHTVRPAEIPEHEHHELCLHLQLTGNSDFEWWSAGRHGIERAAPGSLILLAPGTSDRSRWQGPSDRLILSVRPDALRRKAEELDTTGDIEFTNRWSLQDPSLANLLTEMGREASDGWPLGALYAGLLETSLTSHLLKRHAANPVRLPTLKGRLPTPRLRSVLEFIAANLHRDLTLDEIAKQLRLTPFHFAREFRNTTGQTPYQYVLDQRIALAKQLLRLRTRSVQEIAYEAGFNSPAHFVRAFHQRVGTTPGAWRNS